MSALPLFEPDALGCAAVLYASPSAAAFTHSHWSCHGESPVSYATPDFSGWAPGAVCADLARHALEPDAVS